MKWIKVFGAYGLAFLVGCAIVIALPNGFSKETGLMGIFVGVAVAIPAFIYSNNVLYKD